MILAQGHRTDQAYCKCQLLWLSLLRQCIACASNFEICILLQSLRIVRKLKLAGWAITRMLAITLGHNGRPISLPFFLGYNKRPRPRPSLQDWHELDVQGFFLWPLRASQVYPIPTSSPSCVFNSLGDQWTRSRWRTCRYLAASLTFKLLNLCQAAELLLALVSNLFVEYDTLRNCWWLIEYIAILYYDWTLTFDLEISSIWRRPIKPSTICFILNRYLSVIGNVFMIVFNMRWQSVQVCAKTL